MRKTGGKRRGFCNWILSPLKRLPLFQVGGFDVNKNSLVLFFASVFLYVAYVLCVPYVLYADRAEAALPQYLPLSARLMTTDYENVSAGTYSITFRIYSVETGGTAVWTETQTVTALRGIFTVTLGSVTSLSSINLANGNFYLTVQLAGDTEMTPRKQILPTATALFAGRVQSSSTLPSSTVGAGELFFNSTSNLLYASDGSSWNIVGGDLQQSTNIGATTTNAVTVGGLTSTGATSLQTTLGVTGATTLSSTLGVTGATNLYGSLTVTGPTQLNGDISLGNISISSLSGNIIPAVSGTYDLGSATKTFSNAYIDNLVVGSTSTSGTTATSFTVNDDAAGDETSSFRFYRGGVLGHAAIEWDADTDRFEFSQPIYVTGLIQGSSGLTISGAISGATTINASGAITGGSITDGTATLSSGALSGVTTIATSGAINGATISGGTISGGSLSATAVNGLSVSAGTVSVGVWNGTAIGVGYGGTGLSSFTIGDMIYASGATTLSKLADVATGSVLVSGGVGVAPAWSNSPSLTALTATGAVQGGSLTDGTATLTAGALSGVTTITTSGTINGATISAGSISSGTWTGTTVGVGYGGTGISSYAVGDLIYASGATTLSKLADVATGSVLVSGGVGVAPAWSNSPSLTALTATGAIQGGSLTDGTATLTAGALSGVTSVAMSGALSGVTTIATSSTINGLTISSGAISGATTLAMSGALSGATTGVFSTSLTSPLIIGGIETTSDLNLKTTSGVGTTGADMHFLVGNNGATEAMTILNSGNVGIGTTAPGAMLEVSAGTGDRLAIRDSGTNILLQYADSGALAMYTRTDIATGSMFSITGTAAGEMTAGSGVQSAFAVSPVINQTGTAGYTGLLLNATETATGSGSKNLLDLQVGGTSKFMVNNLGAVGLGGSALTDVGLYFSGTITSAGANQYGLYIDSIPTSAATSDFTGIYTRGRSAAAVYTQASTYGLYIADASKGAGSTITTNYGLYVASQTAGSTNYSAIFQGGNVGIGTTAPNALLQVKGASAAADWISLDPAYGGTTGTFRTGENFYFRIGDAGYTHYFDNAGDILAESLYLGYNGTTALLSTNDTNENLTIDPDGTGNIIIQGNVGIGTTSPTSRIHGNTTLSAATGNEIAYELDYTTNKATSGNDTGLLINLTDTASPGTSYILDLQKVGTGSLFSVDNAGNMTAAGSKAGYVVDAFVNASGSSLAPGTLVALKGTAVSQYIGSAGKIPVPEIIPASADSDDFVVGVVDAWRSATGTRDEAVPSGEIANVVTLGTYRYARVDASFGAISVGDRLSSSTNSGFAKKASSKNDYPFAIALGSLSSGTGTIPIYVTTVSSGNLADLQVAGVSKFLVSSAGAISGASWTGSAIGVGYGGTNITSYAVGDLIYASGATTLSKLADVAAGSVLVSGGVTTAPAWSASPALTSLTISTINATAATNLSIQGVASYGVIFNDSGADVDFRIESDNNANIFFLNAGADAIYFGDGGTTNYTKYDTVGARTMAGGAMPVAEISLLPADFSLDLVVPPALNDLFGTNYQYDVLDYDKTADEVAYISFKMPGNYEAGTNIVVELIWQANVVANEAVWGVQYKAVADGEVIDAAMSTAVTGTFTTNATANYRNTHSITLISPDVAPEETVTLKIYRDADAAADDLDADARLLNVNVQFNVNS